MTTKAKYRIVPVPQPELSTCEAWDVFGGTEPYLVKRDLLHGEWSCTCKDHQFRRGNRARDGHQCKHVGFLRCEIGDHKFLPSLSGPECVRCGMSEAEYEFREYGPPNPSDWEEAMGGRA